jgi:predicted CoA-binding protein
VQDRLSEQKVKQFERIFYPRSIAVVGASTDERKMGSRWVAGLLFAGFKGVVYPVNPSGGEIMKLKIYPRLTDIPWPVDLVICCIPRTQVLDLLNDCAAKQIGTIYFFTAGFRETGEPEWLWVEEEMARRAHEGGFRIIGPNCIGISCPEQGIPYGPSPMVNKIGLAGFISQSGGHAGKMAAISLTRCIGFSKVASIGNCCDLGSADFLEYMAWDPKTGVVGMYLEGPRDSARLFEVYGSIPRSSQILRKMIRLIVSVTAALSSRWVRSGFRIAMFRARRSRQDSISLRKASSTPAVPFFRRLDSAYRSKEPLRTASLAKIVAISSQRAAYSRKVTYRTRAAEARST